MATMRSARVPFELAETPAFGREERLGLGIAIAAHLALFAGLAWWDNAPEPVDLPERISVTVSDEIALESISPNPMADPAPSVAPELGEIQPAAEPITEPVREVSRPLETPRPAPAPRPDPTPAPKPKARQPEPKPAPQPKQPPAPKQQAATGSRIGSDFLSGTGGSGSDRDQPAERAGPATAASLSSAIARALKPHWTAPQGADAEKLVTVLAWRLNRDGSLAGRPEVVSQSGITDANRAQADRHAELAIRAVQLAAPFDLPSEYYDSWKRVDAFRFDRRL